MTSAIDTTIERAASSADATPAGVDVVTGLSAAEFAAHHVAKGRPVLIKGAISGTPAFNKWTFDHLRQLSGAKDALLKDWGPGGEILTRRMQIGAYLDDIEQYEAGVSARFVIFCTGTWTDREHSYSHAASSRMLRGRNPSLGMLISLQR